MSALNENAVTRLATVTGVDLNTSTPTPLYTVPAGKSCNIVQVTVKNASISLTTASISFGFNGSCNDVIADAHRTELTSSSLCTNGVANSGAKIGTAGGSFGIKANTLQGAAATVDIDVFGYLY